jgi:hypothetical protein
MKKQKPIPIKTDSAAAFLRIAKGAQSAQRNLGIEGVVGLFKAGLIDRHSALSLLTGMHQGGLTEKAAATLLK